MCAFFCVGPVWYNITETSTKNNAADPQFLKQVSNIDVKFEDLQMKFRKPIAMTVSARSFSSADRDLNFAKESIQYLLM